MSHKALSAGAPELALLQTCWERHHLPQRRARNRQVWLWQLYSNVRTPRQTQQNGSAGAAATLCPMVGCTDVQILSATLPHTRESTAGSCTSCRVWWSWSQAPRYLNTPNPYLWVDKQHREAVQSSTSPGFLHSHPQMTFLRPHLCSSGLCHLSCSAGGVKTSPSYSTTRSHPFKLSPYTTTSHLQTDEGFGG